MHYFLSEIQVFGVLLGACFILLLHNDSTFKIFF